MPQNAQLDHITLPDAVWRGTDLGEAVVRACSTGWSELDAQLPGGGWQARSLTEILSPQPSLLEFRLAGGALRDATAAGKQVVLVGAPKQPHAAGLLREGLAAHRVIWIEAEQPAQRLWVVEQLVKSNSAGAILAWLPQARAEQIRRLQIAALGCEAPVFLCRPESARSESSAAPLRLHASVGLDWELLVNIFKRRGPAHTGLLRLRSVPGGLEEILTPRLRRPASWPRRWPRTRRRPMPLWAALLPSADAASSSRSTEDVLRGASIWALQFSPKVAVVEASAVLMELSASERLFGGRRRLVQRLREEAPDLGLTQPAWAPTSLAALAVARAGLRDGMSKPLQQVLDPQPLTSIAAVAAHEPMLARLGCKSLKDVRALPRAGVARRFGAPLLAALDQAYGQRPDEHRWVALPETFDERLELLSRVEHAPAMLFGARRLLLQLCAWLVARRSGVTAFTLRWCHDVMRARDAGDGGSLTVRTAEATRNIEHLSRLLAEHLERVKLAAPVGDLQLLADEVRALEEKSATLLPDPVQDGESLNLVLERTAARLGPEKVLRPVLAEDHRMHWMAHWQPAGEPLPRRQAPCPPDLPQPSFMLPKPLRLAAKGARPLYQGPLLLLSGPHRIESGWWDRDRSDASGHSGNEVRDYYVALGEHAGILWVFQTRLDAESVESTRSAWFLAGIFA